VNEVGKSTGAGPGWVTLTLDRAKSVRVTQPELAPMDFPTSFMP
jgi:hypothetical protein